MKTTIFTSLIIVAGSILSPVAKSAEEQGAIHRLWNEFSEEVSKTASEPQFFELYVPAITWHNRFTYNQKHIDRYNEHP